MSTNQILIDFLKERPRLYEPSTSKFWDDEHISKGMLEAHLNPDWEAATRSHQFVDRSVEWITAITKKKEFLEILDLGCGPGLYAERFFKKGFHVTGIDFSARSVNYAKESAKRQGLVIDYLYKNYLEISYQEQFDAVTLIYCDFGVLSDADRSLLLKKVYRALRPGGTFIFDVFTPKRYENVQETRSFAYHETGFWNKEPHLCIDSLYRYDYCNTFVNQCVVVTKETTHCYNIWEHTFTAQELQQALQQAGFQTLDFYGDAAGAMYSKDGDTICAVACK
jgi:2-polyprenyl-3-methyl-5-hydroxy-6-metoxy-1,4-benzoquinol methylase